MLLTLLKAWMFEVAESVSDDSLSASCDCHLAVSSQDLSLSFHGDRILFLLPWPLIPFLSSKLSHYPKHPMSKTIMRGLISLPVNLGGNNAFNRVHRDCIGCRLLLGYYDFVIIRHRFNLKPGYLELLLLS